MVPIEKNWRCQNFDILGLKNFFPGQFFGEFQLMYIKL